MAKALITGGAGFLGYSLAQKIAHNKDNHVTIMDNLLRGREDEEMKGLRGQKNIKFVQGDLVDKDSFAQLEKDYEHVYHLAAIIGVKNVMQNPDKVLSVNAISTINLFEFLKECRNLKKVFFASTSEVYAGTVKHFSTGVPTKEDVPLTVEDIEADRTTYALSKIYGESIAFVYSRKYDIPITIGRYHNVFGPRMGFAHVIPEMFVKINRSTTIDVPSPAHTRAFCFIDDAVRLTIKACESKDTINEIVNIGNAQEEISIKDLVCKIADVMGKKISLKELPDTPGSPPRRCPDTSKMEKLLQDQAVVSLEEGIEKAYQWYKDKLDDPYE